MLWKINFLNAKIRYRAKIPVFVPDGTHFAPPFSDAKGTLIYEHSSPRHDKLPLCLRKPTSMKKVSFPVLMALGLTAQVSFAATVFTENFDYADGALAGASGSPWTNHSGTAGQVNVASNAAVLTGSESEDVNALIAASGLFYNSGTLTATLSVNFSALPNATGAYFAHFKDATTGFRGRVFTTTTGATSGFRLGISDVTNAVASAVFIPTDLSLNTTYALTLTLDVATGRSSLAVAGIGSATATDLTGTPPALIPVNVSAFALRQGGTGLGTVAIDNISVDATALPVPEPSISVLGLLAGLGLMRRRR